MITWLKNFFGVGDRNYRFRTTSGMHLNDGWWNPPTAAGVDVDETTALNQSTIFAAVRVIAGTAASLSLPVLQRLATGGKRRAPEHPLYYVLHDEPNYETNSMQFREAIYAHSLTWGNGYAEIERLNNGRPAALWLLPPNSVNPVFNRRGELRYEVTANGKNKSLWPEDILHIAGLGFDGVKGYSVIKLARESIALTAAAERFGASFFGNNARPSGVFTHPGRFKPGAEDKLRQNINNLHQGPNNVGNMMIVSEGVGFTPFTIPPEEAQYLATREFQISEVARWFGIHPFFLGDLSHSTFSNGEQAMIHFVMHTIRPFCVRIEQELNKKLILPSERREFFAEHNIDSLLRGDATTRNAAYAIGRTNGWLSVNEIRDSEGWNPIEGGDIYLQPLNMASVAPAVPPQSPPNPTNGNPSLVPTIPQNQPQPAQLNARQLESVQGTVIDAYGRMNRREAAAIRRALKKGFWRTADYDEFYSEHKKLLAESLAPSVRAYLAVTGSPSTPEDVTEQLAERITKEHRAWLTDAIAENPKIGESLERAFEIAASRLELSSGDVIAMLNDFAGLAA